LKKLTVGRLKKLLPTICDQKTSQDPIGWTQENPLWGHCAVIALIVQDYFGGDLLRASLRLAPGSHYWNRLPDGTEVDRTARQFGDSYPILTDPIIRTREYVLSYPDTAERYKLLKSRLGKLLQREGGGDATNHLL